MASKITSAEMAQARALYEAGELAAARRNAKRVLRKSDAPADARMEAADFIDATDVDAGPVAAALAFVIILALMLMYFATNGK